MHSLRRPFACGSAAASAVARLAGVGAAPATPIGTSARKATPAALVRSAGELSGRSRSSTNFWRGFSSFNGHSNHSAHHQQSAASSGNARSPDSSSSSLPSRSRCVVVSEGESDAPLQVARLAERPVQQPLADEMLVRVKATAVNPIDTMMCGGYGRDLVSLTQRLDGLRSGECSASGGSPSQLSLGREGVGEVVSLGSALWGPWRIGQRVWFSPRVGGSQGTFAEYVVLRADLEAGAAPDNLSDPEAAALPFAICTAWTALVECAGITPPALPAAAAKFSSRAPQRSSNSPLYLLRSVGVEPTKLQHGLDALKQVPVLGDAISSVLPPALSESAPRRALVHGASGAVGLVAVQLLQRWGYEVYATTLRSTRASLDELSRKQKEAANTNEEEGRLLPTIHVIESDQQDISSVVQAGSLSVFLDGVGGSRVFESALPLLARSGQLVTLRGEGVMKIDEEGILQGAIKGGSALAHARSRAAFHGVGYHWCVSTPSASALDYVGALVRAGLWQTHLQPLAVWDDGLDAAPHALQTALDESKQSSGDKPRHVVLIADSKRR